MSDYLWDKSGEPDPTIERLEELLGARRYEREPLRLPPRATVAAPRRSYAFGSYTRGVAAASIAAGLLLATIGVVWLNELRDPVAITENDLVNASDSSITTQGGEVPYASGTDVSHTRPGRGVDDPIEDITGEGSRHRPRAMSGAAKGKSKVSVNRATNRAIRESSARVEVARATTRSSRGHGAWLNGGVDNAHAPHRDRQNDERQNAKEQLMFALRLASTKLSVARAGTQTPSASETDAGAR